MDKNFLILPIEMNRGRTISVSGDIVTVKDGGEEIFLKDYIGNFVCLYNDVRPGRRGDTHISIILTHRRLGPGDLLQISAFSSEYDDVLWFDNVFRFSRLAVPQMKNDIQKNFWFAIRHIYPEKARSYLKLAWGFFIR